MKKLLISLAVAAVSAGAASAQTAFDGGYYGFGLGYGRADVSNFDGTGSLKLGGPVASGFVGWNLSSGNVVYGGEADLSYGRIDGAAPCINAAFTCSAKVSTLGTLRGRIGMAQGNTLVYATAGLAAGRVTLATSSGGVEFPGTETATGWVAGLGVEGQMGGSAWRYRGEVLHHKFGSETYTTDVPYTSAVDVTMLRFGMVMPF